MSTLLNLSIQYSDTFFFNSIDCWVKQVVFQIHLFLWLVYTQVLTNLEKDLGRHWRWQSTGCVYFTLLPILIYINNSWTFTRQQRTPCTVFIWRVGQTANINFQPPPSLKEWVISSTRVLKPRILPLNRYQIPKYSITALIAMHDHRRDLYNYLIH